MDNDKGEDSNMRSKKPKRRDKTDLGENFIAPDGGWAWVVCLAAGFSSFCVYTPVQQYGIIYRQRMYDLGFDAKQVTTIINSELALAALTGIINGALFRRFTFRQAAIAGGVLVFVGILLTAFCKTFWQYFICFSCLYGIGLGTNLSATALAVNTYFKNNRRRAMGFSTTITGIGPIILPHICTFLLHFYGTQGTILLVAAFSLNTIFCGSTLQPVKWHVKPKEKILLENHDERSKGIILTKKNLDKHEHCLAQKVLKDDGKSKSLSKYSNDSHSSHENHNSQDNNLKTDDSPKELVPLQKGSKESQKDFQNSTRANEKEETTFKKKVVKFFDLDLLTDLTFLNIIQGMTIMMFCELNFSFLTPFILASYGYNNEQISLAMSLMAIMDIIVRFTAPFILAKVKLSNKFLFAIGIVILLIGRIFVTISNSYFSILAIFTIMGFGKGIRTIFAFLIIPSYVPLNRLPGASGLQLFFNALFTMAIGPILGLIADISNYTFMIHLMNMMTILSLLLWTIEWFVRRMLKRRDRNNADC